MAGFLNVVVKVGSIFALNLPALVTLVGGLDLGTGGAAPWLLCTTVIEGMKYTAKKERIVYYLVVDSDNLVNKNNTHRALSCTS